jgi:hypothetical protein
MTKQEAKNLVCTHAATLIQDAAKDDAFPFGWPCANEEDLKQGDEGRIVAAMDDLIKELDRMAQ